MLEPPKTTPMFDERSAAPLTPPHVSELIRSAFSPASEVSRYRRDWIVGQTHELDQVLTGRLGIKGAEGIAEVWDEEAADFTPTAVPAGATVPFAIDLDRGLMAVQPRGGMSLNGIVGAVKLLLNQATSGAEPWTVRTPEKEVSFEEWRRGMRAIHTARFIVRKPNPHYRDTPVLKRIMEEAEADLVRFEAKADGGLDLDAPFLRDNQAHVDAGYGEARYTGERLDARGYVTESNYFSALKSEQEAEELPTNEDGEVTEEGLRGALE